MDEIAAVEARRLSAQDKDAVLYNLSIATVRGGKQSRLFLPIVFAHHFRVCLSDFFLSFYLLSVCLCSLVLSMFSCVCLLSFVFCLVFFVCFYFVFVFSNDPQLPYIYTKTIRVFSIALSLFFVCFVFVFSNDSQLPYFYSQRLSRRASIGIVLFPPSAS
jgi:hypothetical protein